VTVPPADTLDGAVLATATSTGTVTHEMLGAELLAMLGSEALVDTWAVFVSFVPRAVPGFTCTIKVNVWLCPTGSVPPVGGPLFWTNDTNDVPVGSVSEVVAAVASAGPLFVVTNW
jgi:hypothetical protein